MKEKSTNYLKSSPHCLINGNLSRYTCMELQTISQYNIHIYTQISIENESRITNHSTHRERMNKTLTTDYGHRKRQIRSDDENMQ